MHTLARNWWALVLRGAAAILFGILAFVWPGLTVVALVILFGAFALVDGAFALVAAWRAAERRRPWWPMALEGVAGVALGILAFVWPGVTAFALLYLIAAWAIVTGIFEIAAAIRLRKEIRGEVFLGLMGLASVAFGVVVVLFPGAGAVAVVWAIAAYAVVFGVLLVALGIRLRGLARAADRAKAA
ncbi:MAG TPA: DUF308 domain-containing protein [Actinomycetota bacterium]|nr:DUF308 domain-containing protein [Actinomycetota bacterium]